ncbi:MAG: tRNA lysidine(34) synthetase TilS [Candidatus Omnitrophica bacterium]|nr:tRNA lysidine(34) synthetase TilS [Candidatus Omnitrophota bacterium]
MLKEGEKILIGISGGPDSVCLFHILRELKPFYRLRLHLVHFNHKLRGRESDKDAEFVRRLASSYKVPVTIKSLDIRRLAKEKKISVEDAARQARYEFFIRISKWTNSKKIATAHTKDDQAETVLMRLLRGSGATGLSGIPPVRTQDGCVIIRPLLDCRKREILKFLKEEGLPYRIDASNLKTEYLRNSIRLRLIPYLERYNPQIKETLANSGEILSTISDYIQKSGKLGLKSCAVFDRGEIALSQRRLKRYHPAIQYEIVRQALERLKGNSASIAYSRWMEIKELMGKRGSRARVFLPDNLQVSKEYDSLIARRSIKQDKLSFSLLPLPVPGKKVLPGFNLTVASGIITLKEFKKSHKNKQTAFFDYAKIKSPLGVRFRETGDRIVPLGMKGSKKLHDLFVDEKIPLNERDKIPLVISGSDIIWVCGVRQSEQAKVIPHTQEVLKLLLTGGFNG